MEKFKKLLDALKVHALVGNTDDPSHDDSHIKRVTNTAIQICLIEEGDLEVIIPAALFHDLVTYPKDDPRNKESTKESAVAAEKILRNLADYPEEKIGHVMLCIEQCSFSKGIKGTTLESRILQDADRLEATGAISLMRTFSSGGAMKRPLYNPEDPFCEKGIPEGVGHSLNLLYQRLFKVASMMHTKTARTIAARRHAFLKQFEAELKLELAETGMLGVPINEAKPWYLAQDDQLN